MAWTTYTGINATQNSPGSVLWTASRSMRGRVEAQVTDITITQGSDLCSPWNPWSWAWLKVRLCDSSGVPLSNWVQINKTWGQNSAWVYLGFISPAKSIRLETQVAAGDTSGCPAYTLSWKMNVRYDGTGL